MKKSQVYGLSIFIYAIAIAVVLIIGMIGISKEISLFSSNALSQQVAIRASEAAEATKQLFDSERNYIIEKSLFLNGVAGGFSLNNLSLKFSGDDKTNVMCDVKHVNVSFIPEKYIPYWYKNGNPSNCIPSLDSMENWIKENLNLSSTASDTLSTALSIQQGMDLRGLSYEHTIDFSRFKSEGILETKWIPSGLSMRLDFPTSEDPYVSYSFKPFVHLYTKTNFVNLYGNTKLYLNNHFLNKYLKSPGTSPIPVIIDKDTSTDDPDSISGEPFKDLVRFVTYNYPVGPNDCGGAPDINSISSDYSTDCEVVSKVNPDDGLLYVDKYIGCNSGKTDDDDAIKYILCMTINNIDKKLASKPVRVDVASIGNGATIQLVDHNGDAHSDEAINQAIDDKKVITLPVQCAPSNNWVCYGTVKLQEGDSLLINIHDNPTSKNYFYVDVINITGIIPSGYSFDDLFNVEYYGTDDEWHNITYFLKFYPVYNYSNSVFEVHLPSVEMSKIKIISKISSSYVSEVDVFSINHNFRLTFTSFNLTYKGSSSSSSTYYAIDIDNGRLAPSDYANPNPRDCDLALDSGKFAVTTEGGSCSESGHVCCNGMQCCNEGNSKDGKCYSDCSVLGCKSLGDECNTVSECCGSNVVCDTRVSIVEWENDNTKRCRGNTGYVGCGNTMQCASGNDCCSGRCCLDADVVCDNPTNCEENCCSGKYYQNIYTNHYQCNGGCPGGGPGPEPI